MDKRTEDRKLKISEELEKKINKLKTELSCLEYELKQREEPIRLLTAEEYELYRNKIPNIGCAWWLQDRVGHMNEIEIVTPNGDRWWAYANYKGCDPIGVRPVIDVTRLDIPLNQFKDYGQILHYCGITWFQINRTESWSRPTNLYIAEVPIGFRRFDGNSFSKDYDKSEIKEWLLKWYEERKDI